MRKLLITVLVVGLFGVSGSGCGKRIHVTTIEKERVDQEVAGNKGYFGGTRPPAAEEKTRPVTREVFQVEVEVPPYAEWNNYPFKPTEDKDLSGGNRGYIQGGPNAGAHRPAGKEEPSPVISLPEESPEPVRESRPETLSVPAETSESAYSVYVVQKGDTLQKISEKVYGTIKKWKKIFDYNSATLKNPNKIYPGQKLKIPQQ